MTEACAGGGSVSKLKVKVLRNKNQCFKRKKRYIYTSIPKKKLQREEQKRAGRNNAHGCIYIQNLVQPRLEMEVKSIEISDSEAQNLLKGE